jgi:hypothetical protein
MKSALRSILIRLTNLYLKLIDYRVLTPLQISLDLPQYNFTGKFLEDYCYSLNKNQRSGRLRVGYALLIHERPDYLEFCLNSLMKSDVSGFDFTLYLIDDGSKDPEVKKIIDKYSQMDSDFEVKVLMKPKGLSCAGAAINRAITCILGDKEFDLIGFGDPDAIYSKNWLAGATDQLSWIEKYHSSQKVLLYSPYNSQSVDNHRWQGIYFSPFRNFVIKKQMGLVSVLLRPSSLLKIGFFDERPDDEALMSVRMENLNIFCATPEYSLVEHIGQKSVLNELRRDEVVRADFSWKLNPDDWKGELQDFLNPTILRDVPSLQGTERSPSGCEEIEVAILVAPKDVALLDHCINSLRQYSINPIRNVFVIAERDNKIIELCTTLDVEFVDEVGFNIPLIEYRNTSTNWDRYSWLKQQLIKLSLDQVGEIDKILVVDCDQLFIRPQKFIENGIIRIPAVHGFHPPYFSTYSRLFSPPSNFISNIAHYMVFSKTHLRHMKSEIEKNHGLPWCEAVFAHMDFSESSGFSEFETYAHWSLEKFRDKYELTYVNFLELPKTFLRLHRQLSVEYCKFYESIAYPDWKTH